MVKYKKSEIDFDYEAQPNSKIRLRDNDPTPENIWVKRNPEGTHVCLQNHALAFYPFPTWGCIFPINDGEVNVSEMKKQTPTIIEIHPRLWDEYIKQGVITDDGHFIEPKPEV